MRTEYRKKPPYYGKYKYKIEIDLSLGLDLGGTSYDEIRLFGDILTLLDKYIGRENYKPVHSWGCWRSIYLTEEDKVESFLKSEYGSYATYLYKPSPGYESLVTKNKKPGKNALWYNRYPYKIILKIENSDPDLNEAEWWCGKNCFGSFRKSGYVGEVSFFFVSPIDATGFKIMFSSQVVKTEMPDQKIAKRLLNQRILEAKKDLQNFLEGGIS